MTPHSFASALLMLRQEADALLPPQAPLQDAVTALYACHQTLPPNDTWRDFSDLTTDGAPLELAERFGGEAMLGLTLEPRPYAGSESQRFLAAANFATNICSDLSSYLAELAPWLRNRLWIGFDGNEQDVYLPLRGDLVVEHLLAAMGVHSDGEARRALTAHSANGRLNMVALTLEGGTICGVTLYLRQVRPHLSAALTFYPETALCRGYWDDPNTGSAIRLGLDGTLRSEAVYHYTAAYWRTDTALLARLTDVLARRELPLSSATLLAGLIGIPDHTLHRRMVAVSARPDGAHTRFKLYQSAAPYVQHHWSNNTVSTTER